MRNEGNALGALLLSRPIIALVCIAAFSLACSNSEGPPNRPPHTTGVSSFAIAATPLVLHVLSNDSDPDGDALVLAGVTPPAHGAATANADNTITYTAHAGYRGLDAFEYTVTDGKGGTASGVVSLNVYTTPNEVVWTPVGAYPTTPVATPDDAGGVIAAWMEMRPTEVDLRAHRPGHWGAGGVLVGTMQGEAAITGSPLPEVQITPDGEGGAILAWSEWLSPYVAKLSAQRVGADGTVRWVAGGVPVCTDPGMGLISWRDFSVAGDGAGGAAVAWATGGADGGFVLAQHLAASDGAPLWGACGTRASPFTSAPIHRPRLVRDGTGGVIVTWAEEVFIRAQRVDGDGIALWGDAGVPLLAAGYSEYDAVADGAGGEIVATTWGGVDIDIVAQRVDASGALLWTGAAGPAAGVTVTAEAGVQEFPALAADGTGGAVIAWLDNRSHAYSIDDHYAAAIYAQRITGAGAVAWTADGVLVSGTRVPLLLTQVIADGTGGAILAWADDRDGVEHVFAQRLAGADGTAAWVADGMYVADAPMGQGPPVAVSDGPGGAILVFTDSRAGTGGIYSQRLALDGTLP
jgi:hypothetical protein